MLKETHHTAFLVHWQVEDDRTRWRSVIENVYTGEKHHFADKNQLLHFLQQSLFDGEVFAQIEENPQPESQ